MKPQGTIVPLIRLNTGEIQKVLANIRHNIDGVLIAGRTGDGRDWSVNELEATLQEIKSFDDTLPIYSCIWPSYPEPSDYIKVSEDKAVDFLVIPVPEYLNHSKRSPKERINTYYHHLATHISTPIIVYAHELDKHRIDTDTVCGLSELSGIAGIKISYEDPLFIEELVWKLSEEGNESFSILIGTEKNLFPGYLFGAGGNVSSIAQVASDDLKHFTENMNLYKEHDSENFQAHAIHLSHVMGSANNSWDKLLDSGYLDNLKTVGKKHDYLKNAVFAYERLLDKISETYKPNAAAGVRSALQAKSIL